MKSDQQTSGAFVVSKADNLSLPMASSAPCKSKSKRGLIGRMSLQNKFICYRFSSCPLYIYIWPEKNALQVVRYGTTIEKE